MWGHVRKPRRTEASQSYAGRPLKTKQHPEFLDSLVSHRVKEQLTELWTFLPNCLMALGPPLALPVNCAHATPSWLVFHSVLTGHSNMAGLLHLQPHKHAGF